MFRDRGTIFCKKGPRFSHRATDSFYPRADWMESAGPPLVPLTPIRGQVRSSFRRNFRGEGCGRRLFVQRPNRDSAIRHWSAVADPPMLVVPF
ncbi:hypothetical protein BHM03_00006043 [Ensete ventricosum]|nr:hypothetical protein BHM03_00006043 [Ensete ventricosum]